VVLLLSIIRRCLRQRCFLGAIPLVAALKRIVLFLLLFVVAPVAQAITVAQCQAGKCPVVLESNSLYHYIGCFQDHRVAPYSSAWCGDISDYVPPDGTPPGGPYPNLPPLPPPVPTNPHGTSPTVNPIENAVSGSAAAVGFALLGGIAAFVGAPILAVASAATAITVGLMTAASIAFGGSAQDAVTSAAPPLSVTIAPAATAPPDPVATDTSTPAIVTSPTGQFVPGGGNLSSGSGATGGWASGGATGEWSYTPPATVDNPTPAPTARIVDNGYAVTQQIGTTSTGTAPKAIIISKYSDGVISVTNSATLPVTTDSGVATTVDASVTTAYDATGAKLPGDSAVYVAPTLGNGAPTPSGGSGLSVVAPGSGPGTGPTTGGGTGTGTGGCSSGDCSTESTQLANKGLLQSIKDFFTGESTPSADPTARTGTDITTAMGVYNSPLSGVKGWQLPAHISQCPSGTFQIPNSNHVFSMDGHCTFAANNLPLLSSIFLVMWNLAALWIVIRL